MEKSLTIGIHLLCCLALTRSGLAQGSKIVNGVFAWKEDARVRLVIHNGGFTYIDSRKGRDLATPCCDTLTYVTVSPDRGGFLLLKSYAYLNSVFVRMDVVEHFERRSQGGKQ